jgi:ABC-type taurine transport system substrate-binding protein
VGLISGFQLLIVNLAIIGKLRPVGLAPITVIVDSWREATLLKLLWIMHLLPRHKILVVRRASDLNVSMRSDLGAESLLIATSRAFTKHYQLLADLRHQRRLVVL